MDYLYSIWNAITNFDETYIEQAERLKCEKCKTMPDDSCFCIQCVSNEAIIDAYYNSMKFDKNKNSAQILSTILPRKIETSIKEIDKTVKYEGILVEVNTFIQNNPPDEEDV